MQPIIEIEHLSHRYGSRSVYDDMNLSLQAGKIYALLGKNGVGKTTLIKILMGFLRPFAGNCRVFGEPSHALSVKTRSRIGLLFEGHLAWDFFTIRQIEQFYAAFYRDWNSDIYYRLIDRLGLPQNSVIKNMSCGERSQVVLGLLLAQQPELLLLDDYSIGLDAGYRRLFLDIMQEFCGKENRTILLTSHVIQDMAGFVDEVILLEKGGEILITSLADFQQNFCCFRVEPGVHIPTSEKIKNIEHHTHYNEIFSFAPQQELEDLVGAPLIPKTMSLEDAFIGYTGRY
ncbi:MAG: methyltransferase [Desulfobulbus propionicus]|nr:MAG: methyltransferase [Desulfobulbus propionicus]